MPTLEWLNKKEIINLTDRLTYKILENNIDFSYGDTNENMIIKGDNLEVLKSLIPYYKNQIKCVYIDPPYNTGTRINSDENDTGYNDNLKHSSWCSMMYPRIKLIKELLKDDGILAVQIDDDEFCNIYMIMAEIFGTNNLKIISVKMSEATGLKMAVAKKNGIIPKLKEFIVLASKNGVKNLNIEQVPKEKWDKEYNSVCLNVTKEELDYIKLVIENDTRTESEIKKVFDIVKKIKFKSTKDVCKEETGKKLYKEWLYENAYRIVQIATLSAAAKDWAKEAKLNITEDVGVFPLITPQNKMYLINRNFNETKKLPRCKLLFADSYLTINPGDFWQDIKTTGLDYEGGITFKNGKKPEALLKRIIGMSTQENDIILDCFAGSGTTCAVAQKMNRKYIGIEKENHIHTHIVKRLKNVIDGEQQGVSKALNWSGGGGYTFYNIGETLFDEKGSIYKNPEFKTLANFIWLYETKLPLINISKHPLLGIHQNIAYYLIYNDILGDCNNVLTKEILNTLPKHTGKKVIYAESTEIDIDTLKNENIIFKRIPMNI